MHNEDRSVVTLDLCIDAMLAGGEWRETAATSPDPVEIHGLMAVAEGLVELARRTPRGGHQERDSVWARIWRLIQPRQPGTLGAPIALALLVPAG